MYYAEVGVCMTWLWLVEQRYYDNDDVGDVLSFWLCYMHVFSFVGMQYGDWYSDRWWVDWYSEQGTGRGVGLQFVQVRLEVGFGCLPLLGCCFYVDTDVKQEAQLSLTNCAMLFCTVVEDFLSEYIDKKLTTDDNVAQVAQSNGKHGTYESLNRQTNILLRHSLCYAYTSRGKNCEYVERCRHNTDVWRTDRQTGERTGVDWYTNRWQTDRRTFSCTNDILAYEHKR